MKSVESTNKQYVRDTVRVFKVVIISIFILTMERYYYINTWTVMLEFWFYGPQL